MFTTVPFIIIRGRRGETDANEPTSEAIDGHRRAHGVLRGAPDGPDCRGRKEGAVQPPGRPGPTAGSSAPLTIAWESRGDQAGGTGACAPSHGKSS